MKKILTIVGLLSFSLTAFADICGIVTKDQAEKTLSFLRRGARIEQSNQKLTVNAVTVTKDINMGGVDYYDLKVNGVSIDPGHTNIIINRDISLNLGQLVGCDSPASDPHIIRSTDLAKYLTK